MASEEQKTILYEKDGHVAIITKNRPEKLNAMDAEMRAAYDAAIADAEADENIRVVVVTGVGRGWNPGGNPAFFQARGEGGYKLPRWKRPRPQGILSPFHESDKVYIGAINGYAHGGGMADALTFDLRIMAESAMLGPVWAKFAAPSESAMLPVLLGVSRALQVYLTAEPLSAAKCLDLGLANWVCPDAELPEFSRKIAHQLAANAPYPTALTKWMMYKLAGPNFDQANEMLASAVDMVARTEDMVEGAKAFREKRKPEFNGR